MENNCLVGLVVKAFVLSVGNLGLISAYAVGIFTSDLKISTSVATLPNALCYRVRAGTGWSIFSVL